MIKTNSYGLNFSDEIKFYKHVIEELSTVIDVGCRCDNIFYELKPEMEIHLFEIMTNPDVIAFGESVKNIPNIHFNNYGLGSKNEIRDFYTNYQSLSTDWHKYLNKKKEKVSVEIKTLYDYLIEKKIKKVDLLKIDTEAWDFEVMKGMGDKIWDVTYIQFEYGWPKYGDSDTVEDIFNYFGTDYNFYNIGGGPINCVITKKILPYPKIK